MNFYRVYLKFTDLLCSPLILRLLAVNSQRIDAFVHSSWKNSKKIGVGHVTWFHAASVGELEMLMPLIQCLSEQSVQVGVSVFSASAFSALKRLPQSVVYAGFSPRESEWSDFLKHFSVEKVVVSKYEAWPALWASCSQLDLPLMLVNAQARSSLRWVKRFLKLFKLSVPRLSLFAVNDLSAKKLKSWFVNAQVHTSSDPRWVRVIDRSKNALQHPKVEVWKNRHIHQSRPWGMVGSAWLEDLEILVPAFRRLNIQSATLWVIPHSLDFENLEKMRAYLQRHLANQFVLVDEMGFLAELYAIADWVWVGGGFGKGIHSTLEPAVYGVPIACGPKRVDEFFETHELRQHGLLTVCRNTRDAEQWLSSFQPIKPISFDEKVEGLSRLVEQCRQLR